jgi:DNA-binding CsgD family transcriptional regulator
MAFHAYVYFKVHRHHLFTPIMLILFLAALPLMLNIMKPMTGPLSPNVVILEHLFKPLMITLAAFWLFARLFKKGFWFYAILLAWVLLAALDLSRPSALDMGIWTPDNPFFQLKVIWLVACHILIVLCMVLSHKTLPKPWGLISIIYLLYVAADLFMPASSLILRDYIFEPGQDPLVVFNSLSLVRNNGKGWWMLGVTISYYLGYYLLLVAGISSFWSLYRTKWTILMTPPDNSRNGLRLKLSGRKLKYFDMVSEGLSNEEIAEKLGISKESVSKQINNLKHELGLKESLRKHLRDFNSKQ